MNIEEYRSFCLSLPKAEEKMPFDEDTLVFAIAGKMFTATGIEEFARINVKCKPEEALALRERYPAVTPGYYMNKRHWNSIAMDGSISDELIMQWIKESYHLVVGGLTKKAQRELGLGNNLA